MLERMAIYGFYVQIAGYVIAAMYGFLKPKRYIVEACAIGLGAHIIGVFVLSDGGPELCVGMVLNPLFCLLVAALGSVVRRGMQRIRRQDRP